jgi:hypothetical protein
MEAQDLQVLRDWRENLDFLEPREIKALREKEET